MRMTIIGLILSAIAFLVGLVGIIDAIVDSAPADDVQEVQHGEWVWIQDGTDWGLGAWQCSECHTKNNNLPNDTRFNPYAYADSQYCPNCGAYMERNEDGKK